MSFLEDLENNKNPKKPKQINKVANSVSKNLWEGCYKYFKHFVGIIEKNKDEFPLDFHFTFLNIVRKTKVTGPYDIIRKQTDDEFCFEVKLTTELLQPIKITRKDKRSAELLKHRLEKDGIHSKVTKKSPKIYLVELNPTFQSIFSITLSKELEFHIHYKNIGTSNKRSVLLHESKINEKYMDKLAQYIIGQNPSLYTETISKEDIAKIRGKIEHEKNKQKLIDKKIQEEINHEKDLLEARKANTLKEKSKRYLSNQSEIIKNKSKKFLQAKSYKIKNTILTKINNLKKK